MPCHEPASRHQHLQISTCGTPAGIKGAWSLKASSSDAFDKFLVLTFVGETRVLGITDDDELDEAELPGFDADAQVEHAHAAGVLSQSYWVHDS